MYQMQNNDVNDAATAPMILSSCEQWAVSC